MTGASRSRAASRFEWGYAVLTLLVLLSLPFIVGDQPQGADSLNPVSYLETVSPKGDQLKQVILMSLYSGCALLMLQRTPARMYLFLGSPLFLLTGWCFLSIIWSVDPSVTARRCVALLGTVVLGVFLGLRFDFKAVLRLLSVTGGIVLAGSLILAIVQPSLGLDFEGRLRGVFAHKNAVGSFAATTFMVAVGSFATARQGAKLGAVALGAVALVCMATAHSAAVIPVVAAGLAALLTARFLRIADEGMLALVPVLLCVAMAGLYAMVTNSASLAEVVGRDPDISGRTVVWGFVERMIADRPFTGYGFGAFWVGGNSPGAVFWRTSHLGVPHAHDGYLQLALDAGGVGLLLFFTALVAAAVRLVWLLRYTRQCGAAWGFGFLGFYLVTNIDESILWLGNELLVVLFVYIVVRTNLMMRQESRGCLVGRVEQVT